MSRILIAGFGGQGILFAGKFLAYQGLIEGREVSWLPSYGPEMRGGTANCSVVVSDEEIGAAQVLEANSIIVMNLPSLHKFESAVIPGGKLFVNSSIIKEKPARDDIEIFYIDAQEKAEELGNNRGANMVILGAYAKATGTVTLESLYDLVKQTFTGDKAKFVESNIACIKAGAEMV